MESESKRETEKDYVYHGTNVFCGIHEDDVLTLADKQQEFYAKQAVHEIFPEYLIIKADKFDDQVRESRKGLK